MPGPNCLPGAVRQLASLRWSKALALYAQPFSPRAHLALTAASWRALTSGSLPAQSPVHIEDEPFCRQRQLISLGNRVSYSLELCTVTCLFQRVVNFALHRSLALLQILGLHQMLSLLGMSIFLIRSVHARSCTRQATALSSIKSHSLSNVEQTSVWYGCVLRGDLNSIRIGAFSNVQDKTVIHAARFAHVHLLWLQSLRQPT